MIASCWNEDAKGRPEFVSLHRELCVGEFEEMSSHLKQHSFGGSPLFLHHPLHRNDDC